MSSKVNSVALTEGRAYDEARLAQAWRFQRSLAFSMFMKLPAEDVIEDSAH
jgi:hypothetical protein